MSMLNSGEYVQMKLNIIGRSSAKYPVKIIEFFNSIGQKRTLALFNIIQLYEQPRPKKATSNGMAASLGLYVTRWQRWAVAGLQGIKIEIYCDRKMPGTFKNLQYQPIGIPVDR
jgi:hypothetical protein